mmetsp:Transcript_33691/g.82826  ORF Transcript_33691/g.82826 Transcript_33691/m.82826 type:complete len:269 (+) Transcript_33691:135-941(+)
MTKQEQFSWQQGFFALLASVLCAFLFFFVTHGFTSRDTTDSPSFYFWNPQLLPHNQTMETIPISTSSGVSCSVNQSLETHSLSTSGVRVPVCPKHTSSEIYHVCYGGKLLTFGESFVNGTGYIWFQHLRKAGGTTFSRVLRSSGAKASRRDGLLPNLRDLGKLNGLSEVEKLAVKNGYDVVASENGDLPRFVYPHLGENKKWFFVTLMRSPLERLHSLSKYERCFQEKCRLSPNLTASCTFRKRRLTMAAGWTTTIPKFSPAPAPSRN